MPKYRTSAADNYGTTGISILITSHQSAGSGTIERQVSGTIEADGCGQVQPITESTEISQLFHWHINADRSVQC